MRINKKAAAVAVAAVTLAGTGIAYAYWTTTGSGSDTATTSAGDPAAFAITNQHSPASSVLAPGLSGGTLDGSVTNSASANHSNNAVRTVAIQLTVVPADVTSGPPNACDATSYLLKPTATQTAVAPPAAGLSNGSVETTLGGYTVDSTDSHVATEVLYVTGANSSTVKDLAFGSSTPFATNLSFVNKPNVLQDGCKGAVLNVAYTTGS